MVDAPGTYFLTGTAAGGDCTAQLELPVAIDTLHFPVNLVAAEGQIDCNTAEIRHLHRLL
jgi:hypothetical protein